MELLIKNVRIVDTNQDYTGDVYIRDGIIKKIGKGLEYNCQAIDGEGLMLLPAFIDLHCHFRDPGLTYKEDIESGSRAAVKGGYTAVNLMPNTKPSCSSMEIVEYVEKKAEAVGLIHINQTVSITNNLEGMSIEHLEGIESRVKFISDDGNGVLKNDIMLRAMLKAKDKGLTVLSHCEDSEISKYDTRHSENVSTIRDIGLARYTGCPLHICHVSTKQAMEEIIKAKKEGFKISCEVAPHHIALTSKTVYRVNPPLREQEDVDFLLQAIEDGFVDMIATDHAPHTKEDKASGSPGISGIETSFSICYTELVRNGRLTIKELSKLMSRNPGEMMNLKKGLIKEGYDGDVVLVDVNKKFAINADAFASKGKNTPFDGSEVRGKIIITIKGGKIVYAEEDFNL